MAEAPTNRYRFIAHLGVVGLMVAAGTAALTPGCPVDVALRSSGGPLSGSEVAIIVGGTTQPTPSTSFAQTVEELYLHPLGFDDGALDSAVCTMSGSDPCSAPLQVLSTPELIQQGQSTLTAASDIVQAVESQFAADTGAFDAEHPLTVFGYSQSATAGSMAMTQLAQDGIPTNAVHFVFIGNPSTPDGIWANLEADLAAWLGPGTAKAILEFFGFTDVVGVVTPNDLYPATVYTLDTDGMPDFQADWESGGLLGTLGHLLVQHVEYLGLTPEQVADATTSIDGAVTSIDISDDINDGQAWINALSHGLLDSGILQAVYDSFEELVRSVF